MSYPSKGSHGGQTSKKHSQNKNGSYGTNSSFTYGQQQQGPATGTVQLNGQYYPQSYSAPYQNSASTQYQSYSTSAGPAWNYQGGSAPTASSKDSTGPYGPDEERRRELKAYRRAREQHARNLPGPSNPPPRRDSHSKQVNEVDRLMFGDQYRSTSKYDSSLYLSDDEYNPPRHRSSGGSR